MKGTAGNSGKGVRSDILIDVDLRDSGGVEIDLKSKVEVMYGEAIRDQIREGLEALGVTSALVKAEDSGALPFAIAARLEAAVKRALPELDADFLPEARIGIEASARDRFRRSRLYLPGNTPRLFPNAGLHGADAYILDLEDAVAPAEKDAARVLVRNALRTIDFGAAERMVRINQGDRGLEDLQWVIPHPVQLILIPKVEDPEQVIAVEKRIAAISEHCGRSEPVWLMPIIESGLGAIKVLDIARASSSTVAVAIGLEDYTADLGVERTAEGSESFWMRSKVVNACRAAQVQAIDTVFSDVADEAGLRESVLAAKRLGFDGKGCIHPRQIQVVHDAIAPTIEDVRKACRVVIAFEDARQRGLGVVSLGSKMIDAPVVKRSERTVHLALAMKILDENWREEMQS